MAHVLRVDRVDLGQFLRVAQGEGLDPADGDFLAPAFGETAIGPGEPLISVREGNRELAFPLHLGARDAAHDGLVNLVVNPSGEVDTSNWTAIAPSGGSGSISRDTTYAPMNKVGDAHLYGGGSNGSGGVSSAYIHDANTHAVSTGNIIYLAVYAYPSTPGGADSLDLGYLDQAGVFQTSGLVATTDPEGGGGVITQVPAGAAWFAGKLTVPGGVTSVRLALRLTAIDASQAWVVRYDTGMTVALASAGSPTPRYFDGDSLDADWTSTPHASSSTLHAGKDGLHKMVAKLRRTLNTASQATWRDDGATSLSYLDLAFGRFEPAYDYRKAQKLWISGVLRVWALPYAHTGTSRIVGTAAGTVPLTVALGSLEGDVPAIVDVLVKDSSTVAPVGGRVTIVAAAATGYRTWTPAASITNLASTIFSLIGASGAPGSQTLETTGASVGDHDHLRIDLAPATAYIGRNRLLAITDGGARDVTLRAYKDGQPLGPAAPATAPLGYHLQDLGVLTVPTAIQGATISLMLRVASAAQTSLRPNAMTTRLGGVLLLPEDRTALAVDTNRTVLARAPYAPDGLGQVALIDTIDSLGNPHQATHFLWSKPAIKDGGGVVAGTAAAQGFINAGALIAHPTAVDVQAEITFAMAGHVNQYALIGKGQGYNNAVYGRYQHQAAASGALAILVDGNVVASQAVAAAPVRIRTWTRGPIIEVAAWGTTGLIGSLSASHGRAAIPGQTVLALGASVGIASNYIGGARVAEVPSRAIGAGDLTHFSDVDRVTRRTSASVVTGDITSLQIGGPLRADVDTPQQIVAYTLPIDGGPANSPVSVEVRVREQFTYLR